MDFPSGERQQEGLHPIAAGALPTRDPAGIGAEVTVIPPESDDEAAVRLALDYPYDRHAHAFWFEDGAAGEALSVDEARRGRLPVLAFGSNAAPVQLSRKFADRPCTDRLYVEPAELEGWDVIYAARITSYGAIPARMAEAEGCVAQAHVTWLAPDQLAWMDETEGSLYRRARLPVGRVLDATGARLDATEAYLGGGDDLLVGGERAALADVTAAGRLWRSHRTADLHGRLAAVAAFDGPVEAFALRLVRDPGFAAEMKTLLCQGL